MIFSSIPFLYYFLPIVLIAYFIVPQKLKNFVLLVSSLFFYAWGEPRYVFLMAFTILLGYIFGLLIEKNRGRKIAKVYCAVSTIISLSFLAYFKYADFFISNFNAVTGMDIKLLRIALPIGISFYTFQIISYTIDVYRGTEAQRNLISLGAYISMFPQLIAGPIIRYEDINKQLNERTHSAEMAAEGVRRFIIGLCKKIFIANQFGELIVVFRASKDLSVLYFWMYLVSVALQLYFDFSGYSDMAIGLGKIFGFKFMENFNYPYIAKSITDFWRRWHISLGTWFKDYVYIPLGGNRVGNGRQIFNIFVVWFLTGFWHGAAWNFILWGLYFAVLLIIEKVWLLKYLKKNAFLSHIYVLVFALLSFVIFNAESVHAIATDFGGLFGAGGIPLVSAEAVYYLRNYAVLFIMGIIGATPLVKNVVLKISANEGGQKIVNVLEPIVLFVFLIVMTAYLVDGSFNPFLYFRF